jgi:hypothetical protein
MDNWLTVLTGYLNFSFKTWESWWLRMPRATLISMQGVFLFVITAQHWSIVDFAGSRLVLLASEFVCGIPGTGFSVKWISLMFRAWFVHSWLCKVSLYMQLNHNMCAWGQICTMYWMGFIIHSRAHGHLMSLLPLCLAPTTTHFPQLPNKYTHRMWER